jgi:small subunit ribosomal protein S1
MTAESDAEFRALLDEEANKPGPKQGDVLKGTVLEVGPQGMVVDLGLKRDGVIPRADLEKMEQEGVKFERGQEVVVALINMEDKDGNLIVSVHQARQQKDWVLAEELLASGEMWEGPVVGHNRGGLIVQFGDIRAFVPASHVTELPRGVPENDRATHLAALRGKRFGFKVIEVDRQRQRLVLSQRNAQKEFRDQQKSKLLDNLAEGQVHKGVVTGLRDFGAFVDLGGADGLIHISEISWQRVKHPRDVLHVGQQVEVEILKIDRDGKRIGLSLKRRQPDPWSQAAGRFHSGQQLSGTVTRLTNFGAFVDLGEGIEGLIHTSQLAGQPVAEGAVVEVKVLNVEPERQRIGLALAGEAPAGEAAAGEPAGDESGASQEEA